MDELVIRELRPEDYDDLISLWEAAGLPHRKKGRDSRENTLKELSQPMAIFLIAELNGRMIGSALCTHDGRKGWINRLAVAPDMQRLGIATLLVMEAERRFELLGIEVVAALIEDWNDVSKELFEDLDYVYDPHVMYYSKRKSGSS